MTDVTMLSGVSFDAITAIESGLKISELFAGEALTRGQAVYIHTDGTVKKAVSTVVAADGSAKFDGFVGKSYASGAPVTILAKGNILTDYAAAMTPGAFYYVSDTAGNIATASQAADVTVNLTPSGTVDLSYDRPIAKAISATAILVL